MRNTLIVMGGIPASGKSYYSKVLSDGLNFKIHSSDELRKAYTGDYNRLFDTLHSNIVKDLRSGYNCIYDSTNCKRSKRKYIVKYFRKLIPDIKIILVSIEPNLELSYNRNMLRNSNTIVPEEVLYSMYHNYCKPDVSEGFDQIITI